MINIRTKLTGLAILVSGISFFVLSLIAKYEPLGLKFSLGLIVAQIVFGMIMYIYANMYVNRIEKLIAKIELIIKDEYQFETLPLKQDELGRLEEELEKLAQQYTEIIRSEKKEAYKIHTILSGMKEGVVILDQVGRIVLTNTAVEEMFFVRNRKVLVGKHFMYLVRDNHLDQFVAERLSEQKEGSMEFQAWDHIYTVWANTLNDENSSLGLVLVIRDITDIRRLEKMRTEFVANVSHELRTPLTSINGFVETLLDGASEDKELRGRFLNIIQSESLRLKSIIDDLLTLSRIENKPQALKGDAAQKFSFVQNAYEKIRPVIESYAQAKGLEIKVEIPTELPYVLMGEDLLSQVLLNLMENAVKYTLSGQVALSCSAEEEGVVIVVRDTGCGIPQESLSRIFERFYRVDKARSREIGGTGLGLSIVKHIVEDSGGRITVSSELGKGTSFTCYLPCFSSDIVKGNRK
ncbi:MAG: Alkaline phosphatase synthesis sensor protein PhoR [Candidatus Dichloromethanomonas elyunquensis]|nr:MAG: Alkaline phosphatase synthesis sensor protein PhoR [Candidatus Dichloromethanomonas elyunquensis]